MIDENGKGLITGGGDTGATIEAKNWSVMSSNVSINEEEKQHFIESIDNPLPSFSIEEEKKEMNAYQI